MVLTMGSAETHTATVKIRNKLGLHVRPIQRFVELAQVFRADVEVQIGADKRKLRARIASVEEKDRLWPRLTMIYPDYDDYQARTDRDIPVVILEPR